MSKITISTCPICGNDKLIPFKKVVDHSISKEIFDLVRCSVCNLVITQNQPSAASIGPYYASEDYVSHSDTQTGVVNKLYHKVRTHMLNKKQSWVEKNSNVVKGKLLDVGCGTGYFPSHMKSVGWNVKGLEPDDKARKHAVEKFGLDVSPAAELFKLEEKFDVITLWHVLEHVHELNEYIEKFHQLLSDDGILLIAVPNYTSLDAEQYKENWAAYDVPRHLWHFAPQSMEQLLSNHGMKLVKKYTMPFDPFYVALLSEKYRNSQLGFVKGLLEGVKSNMKAWSDTDRGSSVVYISRKNLDHRA